MLTNSREGLDIHKDTPTEILHTILLGIIKYLWAQTFFIIARGKKTELLRARLNAMDSKGLNATVQGSYMCQYRGSLVGKHFKVLSQVMSFAVLGLVSDEVQMAWLLSGELVVLLWHTSITDFDAYLVSTCKYLSLSDIADSLNLSETSRSLHHRPRVAASQMRADYHHKQD